MENKITLIHFLNDSPKVDTIIVFEGNVWDNRYEIMEQLIGMQIEGINNV